MPLRNKIVGCIKSLDPQLSPSLRIVEARVKVTFEGDQVAYLDPKSEFSVTFAEVLRELHQFSRNVYVEVDPESQTISDVQVPATGRVADLQEKSGGDVNFTLDSSQHRYRLPPSNPLYHKFVEALREAYRRNATIILTEKAEEPEIVDIRLTENPPQPAPPKAGGTAPALQLLRLQPVTMERARELFRTVNRQSCNPRTGAPPCIPFLYPHGGCTARAHQMCRLMIAAGVEPSKVWNFGDLKVKTPNEPSCEASWWFHVAPVVQVTTEDSLDPQPYVIDPSLFGEPVPAERWLAVQGDCNSRPLTTSSAPFIPVMQGGGFEYDPTYSQTMKLLAQCRASLRRRCGAHGPPPPPYAKCLEGAIAGAVVTESPGFTDK
jgi:hypothetical protein